MLSIPLQLALAPARTYTRVAATMDNARWTSLAEPVALTALTTGVAVAMVATRRVTAGLIVTIAASWSFTLLIQALAAAVLIGSVRQRPISTARAFELLFLGHAPWTLWMLGMAALAMWGYSFDLTRIILSVVVPIAWTSIIVAAFSRRVLGTTGSGAVLRALVHQVIVWGCGLSYIGWAAGGWMRVVAAVAP